MDTMLYVDLATDDHVGWGICGNNLSEALAALTPITRLGDDSLPSGPLLGSLLQSIGPDLRPNRPVFSAARRVGYAMFEEDEVVRRLAGDALGGFDAVAAACRWGEDVLREAGLASVVTIHQGVDGTRFNPSRAVRRQFRDRFVIFSGGKFELRKGQDVVAQAYRIFADRHADAMLVGAWHNAWPASMGTMIASPHFPFRLRPGVPQNEAVSRWLADAGIDLRRVELIPQLPNAKLASVYANSDVGLFPNRCEGATNLVLMEYMACGRTVVATDFSGHRDVLSDANSLPLRAWRPAKTKRNGEVRAHWCEPNVEEIVERLEQAYRDRDGLAALGRQAASDLAGWTWDRAARLFLQLLETASKTLAS